MGVSLVDIRSFLTVLPNVSVHDSTGDLFFFRVDEQKFPFATIVTHDDPYDGLSNLDRPGVFRLNFPLIRRPSRRYFRTCRPERRWTRQISTIRRSMFSFRIPFTAGCGG